MLKINFENDLMPNPAWRLEDFLIRLTDHVLRYAERNNRIPQIAQRKGDQAGRVDSRDIRVKHIKLNFIDGKHSWDVLATVQHVNTTAETVAPPVQYQVSGEFPAGIVPDLGTWASRSIPRVETGDTFTLLDVTAWTAEDETAETTEIDTAAAVKAAQAAAASGDPDAIRETDGIKEV